MSILTFTVIFSVVFTVASCAVFNIGNRWSQPDTPINEFTFCFNFTKNETIKAQMAEVMQNNWGKALKKIKLTGFKDCSEIGGPIKPTADPVVRVILMTFPYPQPGVSGRTLSMGGECKYMGSTCGIWLDLNAYNLNGTILHEFGHFLSFEHEHMHPKVIQDAKCMQYLNDSKLLGVILPANYDDRRYYVSPNYDHDSIMNYCNFNRNNISKGDIDTVDKFYNNPQPGCLAFDKTITFACKGKEAQQKMLFKSPLTMPGFGQNVTISCQKSPSSTGNATIILSDGRNTTIGAKNYIVSNQANSVSVDVFCSVDFKYYISYKIYPRPGVYSWDYVLINSIQCGEC